MLPSSPPTSPDDRGAGFALCAKRLLVSSRLWGWGAAVILAGSVTPSNAQGGPTAPVTVPAPTAASLGAYGDIPVSLYTGRVDVEVPLHTLQGRTLALPISLSYHGGGVRVAEAAGAAGLGWTLNAGGAVTRVIRGLPDDMKDGYLATRSFLDAGWPQFMECCEPLPKEAEYYLDGVVGRAGVSPHRPVPTPDHTYFDPLPDVFMFNFNGHTGKFILDPGGIRTIPHQNLRITYTTSGSNEFTGNIAIWTIVTDDGTAYEFSAREESGATSHYATTAWYLTEIRSGDQGEAITLEYTQPVGYNDPIAHDEYVLGAPIQWNKRPNEYYDSQPGPPAVSSMTDGNRYEVYLSRITSPTGSVEFAMGSRRDLAGFQRYASLVVKSADGVRTHRVSLGHSYFNQGVTASGHSASASPRLMERLRLDEVKIYGADDAAVGPTYAFEYYGSTPGSPGDHPLPKATSTARDHWGYYNGNAAQSTSLIPDFVWETPHHPNGAIVYTAGPDRSPDASGAYMKAGSLSQIVYPTGGWTTFEYEPHTYSKIGEVALGDLPPTNGTPHPHTLTAGGLRVKRTVSSDGSGTTPDVVTEYDYKADEDTRMPGPDPLPPDRSSGVLVRSPKYLVKADPYWLDEALRAYGSDINGTGMGSHIGYRQVTVRRPGQGRTVHFFLAADGRYPSSQPYDFYEIARDGDPYGMSGGDPVGMMGRFYETSRDWKRGLPTMTLTFDEAGALLSEVRRDYLFSDTDYNTDFPVFKSRALNYQSEMYNGANGIHSYVTYYNKYEIVSAVALPAVVKTVEHR